MSRALPFLILLALTVYCAIDCAQTPSDDLRRLPKPLWLTVILLVPVGGPVAWLVAGRPERPGRGGRRPSRPVAPDDDPDFLRRLEWERRRNPRDEEG